MGFHDIYLVEMLTLVNNVLCRNTFHFKMLFPAGNAQKVVEEFDTSIRQVHKLIFSYGGDYVQVKAQLVSQPLEDSYSKFIEGESGGHPALPIDPRICIYWTIRGDHGHGTLSTGANYWSGVGMDWAQQAPKLHEAALLHVGEFRDYLVQIYGKNGTSVVLQWGVFSKKMFRDHPNDDTFFWFPVTEVRIRPYLASLRSRRPRFPI